MNKFIETISVQQELDRVLLFPTFYNFVICIIFSFLLKEIYIRKSKSFSGKLHIGNIIPVFAAGIFIVITVVKSSLALSLGLVGALSIVRFRTPVKEPEDLIYLFLTITLGLGYGSGNTLVTTSLFILTLLVIYVNFSKKLNENIKEYNLIINCKSDVDTNDLINVMKKIVGEINFNRIENLENGKSFVLSISIKNYENLELIFNNIKKLDPNAEITFFENNTNW
jgi:hypothetical protein